MLALFIDIDNCPDYLQVFRAVQRHTLELYVVTRDYLDVDMDVHLILAQEGRRRRARLDRGEHFLR